jgi:hypothetical protein
MPNISDMPTAVALGETDYQRPILELADGTDAQVPQQNVQFTVAAEDTNVIAVTGQIYDYNDLLERATELTFYFASDAAGTTITTVSGALAMGAKGTLIEAYTAKSSGRLVTDSSGTFILDVTDTATDTVYLVVEYGGSNKQFIATMPFAS